MIAHFTFTTSLTRGRMEREIDIEAEYTVTEGEVELTKAVDRTDGQELSDSEWEAITEQADEHSIEAYAEWMAEYGEYLNDMREDRRAA